MPATMRCSWLLIVGALAAPTAARAQSAYEELQTFSSLLSQIRLNYVDSVSTARLVRGAINGMLATLDPHSYFESGADATRTEAWRNGTLAGAGIVVEDVDDAIEVEAVLAGTPAARAGISPGDRVRSLNDTAVAGLNASQVQARLIGDKGTRLLLGLERGSRLEPETLSVHLKLDVMRPRAVSIARSLPDGVGYVRLEEFLPNAGHDLHDAVDRALRGTPHGQPRRLILDLRGNPGGVVTASVDVAEQFLPAHTLVFRSQGRHHDEDQEFRTARDGDWGDVALIVLVDNGTASAAEALTASLQDHDRALIAGRRTFGKALMQRAFLVPPNDDVVWLTVGYILSPSGRLIQRRYHGLNTSQYYSEAGSAGTATDTAAEYHTDHGRVVRAGGGIRPDTTLPAPATVPAWFLAAADTGLDDAVADSVAATLGATPAAREAWMTAPDQWRDRLVTPFLTRVRAALRVQAVPDSAFAARLGRILAARAAQVRWGDDALEEFRLRNDPDVAAALTLFPQLPTLLHLTSSPGSSR